MPQPATATTLPGYEVHLPVFQGPLELLLHLIEKNELDITQVALAQVTDEFIVYINVMRAQEAAAVPIELLADFLSMAARLVWIKSALLLPKPSISSANRPAGEEDTGDELVRQLRAYRQYKEASQWLRERDTAGLRAYVGITPSPRPQKIHIDLSSLTLKKLMATALAAFYPSEGPRPQEAIQKPRISIVQQIRLIRQQLLHWAKVSYRRLLSHTPTRVEAVVTLQAILELIKQGAVDARQEQMFGDILIAALIPAEQIPEPAASLEATATLDATDPLPTSDAADAATATAPSPPPPHQSANL